MSQVVVVAIMTAVEGQRDELEKVTREIVIAPTHQEEGCLTYALHRDIRDANKLAFIERWESMELLQKHLSAPHLAEFREKIEPLCAEPMQILVLEGIPEGDATKGVLGA